MKKTRGKLAAAWLLPITAPAAAMADHTHHAYDAGCQRRRASASSILVIAVDNDHRDETFALRSPARRKQNRAKLRATPSCRQHPRAR